jgi:hypothetical protein
MSRNKLNISQVDVERLCVFETAVVSNRFGSFLDERRQPILSSYLSE